MPDYLKLKTILTYDEVVRFPSGDSTEPLADVRAYDLSIVAEYLKEDMLEITGNIVYVRDSLARKLALVNQELNKTGYRLKVVYGYRHPEVQSRYFEKRRSDIKQQFTQLDSEQLDRYTHNFVAVPSVAGHPAAAAVDLTLINPEGQELDMGSAIADYSDPSKIITFSAAITLSQMKNRVILHDAMVKVGFAPFYGEWWHFSYGDREWAAFYNKKALFGAVDFKSQ